MPTDTLDVLVVGAGPAGVAAGITARARGLRTLVVDKATFPRDKTCGDGLTAAALRAYESFGLDVRAIAGYAAVTEARLVSPSGRQIAFPLPTDGVHAAVVPRAALDAAFVTHARALGVTVREHAAIEAVHTRADGVEVLLEGGGRERARWIVAADGHFSPTRRLVDPTPGRDLGTWHAFRQYFTGVEDTRLWVVFLEDLVPGYAWVFPVAGGRANVGFGVLRDGATSGRHLRHQWASVVAAPALREVLGAGAAPEGRHRAWPIPAAFDPDRLVHGRTLFTGDAASVVDPMTGEGIAQALDTGRLAAAAVAGGGPVPAVAARYRRAVVRHLGLDLGLARALQRVLGRPVAARAAIRVAGATAWTRRNFARWMFEDYPRAVLATPRRWSAGIFTPPGAYLRAY